MRRLRVEVRVRLLLRSLLIGVAPLVTLACSSSPSGALRLITGEETDTFSREPAPTKLEVDSVDLSGNRTTLATAALPTSTIDLGSHAESTSGTFQVTGSGADGSRLVYGQSLPLSYGALEGQAIPVFVQRTGELARMPSLPEASSSPTLALLGGRILFVGSSQSLTSQLYDFAYFGALDSPPTLPRVPKSVALVGTALWIMDDEGATAFDFSQHTHVEVTLPVGGSFADVAGGATVYGSDGSQYVVGATRMAPQGSKTVLAIDPTGTNPSWVTLSDVRLGAAATWVDGRGLVVAGGSETLPGVEIIAPNAKAGSALCYPPDSSLGSAAVMLDGEHILLAGGVTPGGEDAGVRVIDLTQTIACRPAPWAALPVPLTAAQAFASDPSDAIVVGSDQAGMTRVFRLTSASAVEVPTKAAHNGARAIVSPFGSVVIYGGARELESYVP